MASLNVVCCKRTPDCTLISETCTLHASPYDHDLGIHQEVYENHDHIFIQEILQGRHSHPWTSASSPTLVLVSTCILEG
jgi:hypothetical protein